MKKIIMVLLFSGFVTSSYAQPNERNGSGPNPGSYETEEVPELITKNAGMDLSVYRPDKNPDYRVRVLQRKFFDYDPGTRSKGTEPYTVTVKMENGSLAATYNGDGKLTRVTENYKNVKLPNAVVHTILKTYPEWSIVADTFVYTQEEGNIIKKQYRVKIKKEHQVRHLSMHPNGEIVD